MCARTHNGVAMNKLIAAGARHFFLLLRMCATAKNNFET
jgi:hypothetical protein